ncbi:hypothetical protein AVEN_101498-1 [Araneus ventricosus]|uniref:Uncharacterized protein n=1 Tax=Araneus ventricosus TaxID=182803 RepID=A0A4Y2FF49_ARAVE|nr:hypothetical protein AVEN_101498-1 [Araneus ventricosus]
MTRTTSELSWHFLSSRRFRAVPAGGRFTHVRFSVQKGPQARRILSGIGFRTWSPPAPKTRYCTLGQVFSNFFRRVPLDFYFRVPLSFASNTPPHTPYKHNHPSMQRSLYQ